jgi:16S rRNA (cytosine1402-N4)-methyltransferase
MREMKHIPVMIEEVLAFFHDSKLHTFFEGTVGAGGHALALLESHPEIRQYIGCDQDPDALRLARDLLAPWKEKLHLENGNFADLDLYLKRCRVREIDGFFLI